MDSGDLGGLESMLQNMTISSNGLFDLKSVMKDVLAIYGYTVDKLKDEEIRNSNYYVKTKLVIVVRFLFPF